MSHEALGPQFAEHLASFSAPADSGRGLCERVSENFCRHLGERGINAGTRDFADPVNPHAGALKGVSHTVVEHAGHVIDWTAQQFWPDAPKPLVEPLEAYRKRFRMDYG